MDTLLGIGLGNAVGATVLAVLAAVVGRLRPRPALRHGLWLLVLLKLVTPPLVPLRLPQAPVPLPVAAPAPAEPIRLLPEPTGVDPGGDGATDTGLTPPQPPPQTPDAAAPAVPTVAVPRTAIATLSWQAVLLPVWLLGSCLWWIIAGWRLARFRRLLRYADPAPAPLQDEARRLAGRLGLRRCPGVWLMPAAVSPMLWALGGTPRLLLPAALWERLGARQREALLLHELAHLRRRDHWVRWLELAALGLYWWHPVAWWARRELREAEEQCCDAWVLWALPEAGPTYAAALLETVAFLSQTRSALPAAASGAGRVRPLKRRLTMILRGSPSRTLSWGGLLVVLGLAALLPLWPTWVQAPRAVAADDPLPADHRAADPDVPARKPREEPRRPEPPGVVSTTDPAAEVQQLEDEVELLEARLAVKQAEVEAARTAIATATKALQAYETGPQRQRAEVEIANQEAQLRVKEAELREPEVRLKQARRRLAQLRRPTEFEKWVEPVPQSARPEAEPGTAWARGLFEYLDKDLGMVWGGEAVEYKLRFLMKNRTGETVHIASVRMSAGFTTARAEPQELAPGAEGAIEITLDPSRVTGEKVVKWVVTFDRPRPASVVLSAHFVVVRQRFPHASTGTGAEPAPADTQKRLQDLEKKLDDLLKEMEALRRDLHPAKPGAMAPEDKAGDVMVTHTRRFKLPFELDPKMLAGVRKVILLVSTDGGTNWKTAATVSPDQKHFDYEAPTDGPYWFKVYVVDNEGKAQPPHLTRAAPDLKVLVQSNP